MGEVVLALVCSCWWSCPRWREDRLGEQSLQGPDGEGHLGGPEELGVLLRFEQGDDWRL